MRAGGIVLSRGDKEVQHQGMRLRFFEEQRRQNQLYDTASIYLFIYLCLRKLCSLKDPARIFRGNSSEHLYCRQQFGLDTVLEQASEPIPLVNSIVGGGIPSLF